MEWLSAPVAYVFGLAVVVVFVGTYASRRYQLCPGASITVACGCAVRREQKKGRRMKTKARKAAASRRAKDLGTKDRTSRSVKGGAIKKAPAPGGPVPIPYPN